jgi:hypothetical protein
MPQTPEDLSKIIREMAERQAKVRGRGIDNAALNRISLIPVEYSSRKTISVNLAELESMISDVIEVASNVSKGDIGQPEIEVALKKVSCHYLWFC